MRFKITQNRSTTNYEYKYPQVRKTGFITVLLQGHVLSRRVTDQHISDILMNISHISQLTQCRNDCLNIA